MADIRDRADEWLTKVNAWHPDVRVDVEPVKVHWVECNQETRLPVKGVCPERGSWRTGDGDRHDHLRRYDAPHERIVIRLPVEPARDQP